MSSVAVEWAPFVLAEGADEERLLKASEALQTGFLGGQPGFIRRELLRGQDGQWVDIVYWATAQDAQRAVQSAAESPVCYEYFRLMKGVDHHEPGEGITLLDLRRTYEPSGKSS